MKNEIKHDVMLQAACWFSSRLARSISHDTTLLSRRSGITRLSERRLSWTNSLMELPKNKHPKTSHINTVRPTAMPLYLQATSRLPYSLEYFNKIPSLLIKECLIGHQGKKALPFNKRCPESVSTTF